MARQPTGEEMDLFQKWLSSIGVHSTRIEEAVVEEGVIAAKVYVDEGHFKGYVPVGIEVDYLRRPESFVPTEEIKEIEETVKTSEPETQLGESPGYVEANAANGEATVEASAVTGEAVEAGAPTEESDAIQE